MIGYSSPTTTIILAITSSTVIKSAYSIGIFSPHERAVDDEIFREQTITNESQDISLFDSLFGPSTAVGKITTQAVTICQTLEECTSAVNELDMPLRVGDYQTKG